MQEVQMASANDILDERLARGEITPEEHEQLSARLGANERPAPAKATERALLKGSWFWAAAAITTAISGWVIVDNGVDLNITSCLKGGRDVAYCREYGIKWSRVYFAYTVIAAIGVFGVANLFLPKK